MDTSIIDVLQEPKERTWEEYIAIGIEARILKDKSQWVLGELASQVQVIYGENSIGKYAYAIGVSKKTLMNYRTVVKAFPQEIREKFKKLSFSHFAVVAPQKEQLKLLEEADTNDWSVDTLRREAKVEDILKSEPITHEIPPHVMRCKSCQLWRLENLSSFDICRGHYVIKDGVTLYE